MFLVINYDHKKDKVKSVSTVGNGEFVGGLMYSKSKSFTTIHKIDKKEAIKHAMLHCTKDLQFNEKMAVNVDIRQKKKYTELDYILKNVKATQLQDVKDYYEKNYQ